MQCGHDNFLRLKVGLDAAGKAHGSTLASNAVQLGSPGGFFMLHASQNDSAAKRFLKALHQGKDPTAATTRLGKKVVQRCLHALEASEPEIASAQQASAASKLPPNFFTVLKQARKSERKVLTSWQKYFADKLASLAFLELAEV